MQICGWHWLKPKSLVQICGCSSMAASEKQDEWAKVEDEWIILDDDSQVQAEEPKTTRLEDDLVQEARDVAQIYVRDEAP